MKTQKIEKIANQELESTISIAGENWNVEVDTFLDTSSFPANYHGEFCDVHIRTANVAVDFFITIGNVKAVSEAIDTIIRAKGSPKNVMFLEKEFSITNVTLNGKWYNMGELKMQIRTPNRVYLTFGEKEADVIEQEYDDILSYDMVVRNIDIADICNRIITNYERMKK